MIHGFLDHIEPTVSDDEDDERPDAEFAFRSKEDGEVQPQSCKAVLVCSPGAATAYAISAFSLTPVQWSLEVVKETLERTFPPPPRSPRFYVACPRGEGASRLQVAVALLEAPVPDDMAAAWSEALLSAFGEAEVLVLDRIFRAGWRVFGDQERPQEPHLCGLWTASWGCNGPTAGAGALAVLPAPNAADGLAAALLTQCEAARRRCLVALAVQDGAHLGEGSLRAFEGLAPLFERLGLRQEGAKAPDYQQAVRQTVPPSSLAIYA